MQKWQSRWNEQKEKAQWTKRMIPNIKEWTERKHGEIDYHVTQFLSGHGCFTAYLHRFGKRENDRCWYCEMEDTVEHTFFHCQRWEAERNLTERNIAVALTPENIVTLMLEREDKWEIITNHIRTILKTKERDEREKFNPNTT